MAIHDKLSPRRRRSEREPIMSRCRMPVFKPHRVKIGERDDL